MKCVLIIYAPALECFVLKALEDSGQKKYTKAPYLHGVGGTSEPHLDTSIWPGSNSALLVVVEDAAKKVLLEKIGKLKNKYSEQGIKAFVFPVEDAV